MPRKSQCKHTFVSTNKLQQETRSTAKGTINSVVSVDETDEKTVGTWFLNLPTTVKMTASATYF